MSFSLQILDELLINKVADLDSKINDIIQSSNRVEHNRVTVLEDRMNIVENQCKILSDLFNICNNQTFDNKLIQTMLLDLTISSHNNSIELNMLKQRFEQSSNTINTSENDAQHFIEPDNRDSYSYTNDSVKWTKVKKKKKNRKR